MFVIRHLYSIKLVKLLSLTLVEELIVLIDNILRSILQIVNFKLLFLFTTHFSQELSPFLITHMGIIIESVIFIFFIRNRLCLFVFVSDNKTGETNTAKLLLHFALNVTILDEGIKLPSHSSIFTSNQISLKQSFQNIRCEI